MTLSNVYSSVDCWWLCKAMIQHLGSKFNANIVIQYDAGLVAFLPRDAMHSPNLALARGMAVCPSVRLSHDGILSKRLNTSLKLFSPSGNTPLIFFRTNGMEIFRRWPPPRLTGASNAGVWKIENDAYARPTHPISASVDLGWPWLLTFLHPRYCDVICIYPPGLVKIRFTFLEICRRKHFVTYFGRVWPWPFDSQSWSFYALAAWTTCASLRQNRFISFQNIVFTTLATNERTDGRMNGQS